VFHGTNSRSVGTVRMSSRTPPIRSLPWAGSLWVGPTVTLAGWWYCKMTTKAANVDGNETKEDPQIISSTCKVSKNHIAWGLMRLCTVRTCDAVPSWYQVGYWDGCAQN